MESQLTDSSDVSLLEEKYDFHCLNCGTYLCDVIKQKDKPKPADGKVLFQRDVSDGIKVVYKITCHKCGMKFTPIKKFTTRHRIGRQDKGIVLTTERIIHLNDEMICEIKLEKRK
jgi:hypothetical protein